MLTLILGGARSGKSRHAEQLAAAHGGTVLYVATAEPFDEDMAARIARHKAERPAGWTTLEAPRQTGAAIQAQAGDPAVVLVDCLTVLASNVIIALPDPITPESAEAALTPEVEALLAACTGSQADWFIVSNEVGLGIVPATSLGRLYRDALGRANQRLANAADRVMLMVAGLPLAVK